MKSTLEFQEELFQQHLAAKGRVKPESKSTIERAISSRLARGQDTRIIICGENGIGKSTLSLRLGELVAPQVFVDHPEKAVAENVTFTPLEYMHQVRSLPSGSVLISDESGQSTHHRESWSPANIIMSKLLIGYRYHKFCAMFNLPTIDLLDADGRRLTNYYIFIQKQGDSEVFRTMISKFGGPAWYEKIVDHYRFTKPRDELFKLYEARKFANQDALYESMEKELKDIGTSKRTNADIIMEVKSDPTRFQRDGKLDHSYIMQTFNVGLHRAESIKRMAERSDDYP